MAPHETDNEEDGDYIFVLEASSSSSSSTSSITSTSTDEITSTGHKKQAILKSKRFGGNGGDFFNHVKHEGITKITIRADKHAIQQLSVVYMDGKLSWSGIAAGDKGEQIVLSDKEYITEIKVRHNRTIHSLTMLTNNGRRFGPVGGKGWSKKHIIHDHEGTIGSEETVTAPNGHKLCGFSGSAGIYLDSIVFHWIPINNDVLDEKKGDDHGQLASTIFATLRASSSSSTSSTYAITSTAHKRHAILKSKRFGGDGGNFFNHGNLGGITKITIRADKHAIHQLCVVHMDGKLAWSGIAAGDKGEQILLSNEEYVTKITVRHNRTIHSLTMITNNGRRFGPIGGKGWPEDQLKYEHEGTLGPKETVTAPYGHKLCGFSGSAGMYLDSIAFHWIPI